MNERPNFLSKLYLGINKFYSTNRRRHRRIFIILRWLLWLAIFMFFFGVSSHRLDPDFGWHIAGGQDILLHGIRRVDLFTYTAQGFSWINVEWLNDVLIAKLYSIGGYNLLVLLFSLLWTVALMIVARIGSQTSHRLSSSMILAAALLFEPYLGVRTELWMVLFVAIAYRMLITSRKRIRWFLPLVFWLWAQLHGSWPAGIALIGWWALFCERDAVEKLKLWLIALVGFIITFINPYGINELFVIAQTGLDPTLKVNIGEWAPFWHGSPHGIVVYVTITFAVLLMFFVTPLKTAVDTSKKINFLRHPLLYLRNCWYKIPSEKRNFLREPLWPFLLASISATRYWPLFAIVSLIPLDQKFHQIVTRSIRHVNKIGQLIVAGLVLFLVAFYAFSVAGSGFSVAKPINVKKIALTPAVKYLRDYPCAGRLFNSYDFGGYLIWQLPGRKVFIDGRMPSWTTNGALFGPTYMQMYLRVMRDANYRQQIFAKYNIQCALIQLPLLNNQKSILKMPGWRTVLQSRGYVLLEKSK